MTPRGAARLLACTLPFVSALVHGQTDSRPQFDVASVKPSDGNTRTRWTFPSGQVLLLHTRLKDAVPLAYGLQPFLISGGPAWFATDFYDIVGKLAVRDDAPPRQQEALEALQVLLEDRFKLRIHRESKNLELYKLTVAKGGFKLHDGDELPEGVPGGFEGRYASRIVRKKVALASLVTSLSAYLDAPVEDLTGLHGLYSFVLEWPHDQASPGQPDTSDSAMLAALRTQLGLNLERGKGPVQTLTIDSAERPAAN
jgi:uncharacterized protein (TIGR03435 family)